MSRSLKNLLVTGGSGFMGSAFIRALLSSGFDGHICNLDALTYAANLENLSGIENDPRYRFVQGDIADRSLVKQLLAGCDAVVHFAAESHVDRSIAASHPFVMTNVVGTHALLETLREFPGCHFHHISTDEVYGDIQEGYAVESDPYAPNSPYAASKAASDHFVRCYGKTYGLSVTISHASNVYGPGQHAEKFIPVAVQCMLEDRAIPVYGDGLNVRDWLYIDDHARAIQTILEKGVPGEIYNISAHQPMTNLKVIEHIGECMGKHGQVEFVADRPGHDRRYAMNASHLHALGWKPRVSFVEGLEKTVEEKVCIANKR